MVILEWYANIRHNNHNWSRDGPLTRNAKLRFAHALGIPGTFFPPLGVSDPDMHFDTCVTHVPWCMPGSLTSGFLWSRLRGKRSRHSRCMRNPQFCLSGKRPVGICHGSQNKLRSPCCVAGYCFTPHFHLKLHAFRVRDMHCRILFVVTPTHSQT